MPGRLRMMGSHGGKPVLRAPSRGVGGIDDDRVQARVCGHLHQPVAELPGRDAGDGAAEPSAAAPAGGAAPGSLAALSSRVSEVEVLDHQRPRLVRPGGGNKAADGGT
jgi:hypothetical protein